MSFLNTEHEQAYKNLESGNYQMASEMYSILIARHPETPVLYSERGVCFIHLGKQRESLADFDESVRLQPDYAYRYASRGHAKDAFGDLEGAIADYQKAVELDPKDDILHNNLGVLLEKKGYQKQAKEAFERSDKVRKAEEAFEHLISEVEGVEAEDKTSTVVEKSVENTPENESSSPSSVENKESSIWREMKQIFNSKEQRAEFVRYLSQGFRIKKKND